jgi:hypothetical protein
LGNIDLAAPPAGALVEVPVEPIDPAQDATTMAVADVNGDGRPDVAVGETGYQKTGDIHPGGSVLVLLGATAFPSGSWRIIGASGTALGSWVAARDMDGDHRAEIAASAVDSAVYVVRGRSATTPVDLSVNNPGAWTMLGAPATLMGVLWGVGVALTDVTGDHLPDLLIGAPRDLDRAGRVSVMPDIHPPVTTTPIYTLVTGRALSSGLIPVRLAWTASDDVSGVGRYELKQSTDGGVYVDVSTTLTSAAIYLNLAAGHTYKFRVRAFDKAGNVGLVTQSATMTLTGIQQSSSAIHYVGTWTTSTSTTWWGGTAKGSTMPGATASYTFTGRSIGWIGLKAYNRGKAQIYVNGVLKATIDLYSPTLVKQTFVWTANYATRATRTILIKVLGTSGRPKVDVDGLVVLG